MTDIFVSHSHHDREIAGTIKEKVERFGASVFVAHEDIKPSAEWQEAIKENLKHCDAFLVLLTDRFQSSEWTDQETGMAVALDKIIIPIKIDLDPYGFISKYQALKWDSGKPVPSIMKLIHLLIEKNVIQAADLIGGFSRSYSFADAEFNAGLLKTVKNFSKEQINEVVSTSTKNDQIWKSYGAKSILKKLFSEYSDSIKPELMQQWKECIGEK